jgi:hypothetical protein
VVHQFKEKEIIKERAKENVLNDGQDIWQERSTHSLPNQGARASSVSSGKGEEICVPPTPHP